MADFAGQRVLVTGASGFIGMHLIRRLLGQGAEVHTIQRQASEAGEPGQPHVWRLDLADGDAVAHAVSAIRPAVVFHAAASRAEEDWQSLVSINVMASVALLEACAGAGVRRLVSLGTSQELLEEPPSAFAASRSAGALLIGAYGRKWGQPVTHIRSGYVYGPGMPPQKFIPAAVRAGIQGTWIPITPDEIKRNYVHVDDLVDACLAAAHLAQPDVQTVDAVASEVHSARDVTETIAAILEKPVAVRVTARMIRDWDRNDWAFDPSGAQELLGWQARVGLPAGLAGMIRHVRRADGL